MDKFKSTITPMLARLEDEWHLPYLAAEIAKGLTEFLRKKLAEKGKLISPKEAEEFSRKIEMIHGSESLEELDKLLWSFEQMAGELVELKAGELQFAAAAWVPEVFKQVKAELEEHKKKHPGNLEKRGVKIVEPEAEKKEGKILKFPPDEKGRH
ncbi:TPA: hypothetical protein DEQ22_01365 [Candidatus Nomurabacteria bacterium]|uniref:Uncharacterized protein n=2 Tax=Candidatus Nomuraibacteriota TaxID=1752729 RepID=A0A1F6YME1_9BACT|nr:MAG: hypothetical protein A3A11_00535 [Candidatus Nomurabacteria bacterium RIFCSPLOWO2_01_FULL_43_15]OGJ04766.1 MAG: hypothetical protein A2357_02515 [Candidatus Nomurabacteria bacterium RIFOXYB1_FULL_43_14]OGJ07079.1 MAG: hypothetical protein A2183_00400 [Candidatus Nomurabacteria bacterium RIFOXYA1_FULL_42_12]OGJ07543.1 MAG: hypothetical protein A2225_02520 [Candidatus Nomurabacteria bacterium RIFOXYA2_FULL_42_12]OGJ10458.1 MAG: hypothetical protein A2443_01530 [Candidatus Nomurabacteria b